MRGDFPRRLRVCKTTRMLRLYISICGHNCVIECNETFSSPACITLKMEAGYSVETSVGPIFQITWRHVPLDLAFWFVYTTTHCSLKAYCAILVRLSDFRHQASTRVSPRESTQRRKVEFWVRNVRKFCLNADFHVTFRDLLHAVMLRHGTDGFTSPPKEGALRIFSP